MSSRPDIRVVRCSHFQVEEGVKPEIRFRMAKITHPPRYKRVIGELDVPVRQTGDEFWDPSLGVYDLEVDEEGRRNMSL